MGISCKDIDGGRLFKLDTPNSSYIFRTADTDGFILHMYYGKRLADPEVDDLARINEPPFLPSKNAIGWERKFSYDLQYIKKITFAGDFAIVMKTILKVFGKKESSSELDVTDDYGDALLKAGRITREEYEAKQAEARELLH